jgi:hypothetical protein
VSAQQTGGSGGNGVGGADGGDGADSVMVDAVSGSTGGLLRLNQTAWGGAGGDGSGNLAGAGGDASSSLTATNPTGAIQGTIAARGFTGGDNSGAGDGGDGGSVTVSGNLTAAGDVTLNATATPGPAGSVSGSGTGGNGGTATVAPGALIGTSTGGGTVDVDLLIGDINAGRGGGATAATGTAGDGTSISITDAVDGATSGTLLLSQNIFAGGAGFAQQGATLGTAGTAFSSLSKTGSFADLRVESIARGGAGSGATTGFVTGDGGIATAIGNATNDAGIIGLNVGARGGDGGFGGLGGGNGADALAQGTATAVGPGATNVVINQVSATGGNTWGGIAGDGTATATGTGSGNGLVTVWVEANGGFATGGSGGLADATAIGFNFGANNSSISTIARGGNVGSSAGQGGDAIANSSGSGQLGSTTVAATAQSGTSFGGAADGIATANSAVSLTGTTGTGVGTASSSATGGGGSASSSAQGSAGNITLATAQATAPVAGGVGVRSTSESFAGVVVNNSGFLPSPTTYATREAVAYVAGDANIIPGLTAVHNPNVWDGFVNVSDPLAYGIAGGGAATGSVSGDALVYTSVIDLAVSITPTSDDLLIGFLDPLTNGNGFDSLHLQVFIEGNLEVDETFLNSAAADAFFDDNLLVFTDWEVGLVGDLDLQLQFEVTASNAGDRYFTSFAIGVVPIPPAVWLFGSGLLGLIGLARRKRSG